MDNIRAIRIDCNSNPDYDGFWQAEDMQEECEYLGQPKENWISHLLGHLFVDTKDWTAELENAFLNDNLRKMTVVLDGDTVTLIKVY